MHIYEQTRPFAPVGRFKQPSDLFHVTLNEPKIARLVRKACPQKKLSWDPGTPEYKKPADFFFRPHSHFSYSLHRNTMDTYDVHNRRQFDEESGIYACLITFATCSGNTYDMWVFDNGVDMASFCIEENLLGPAVYGRIVLTDEEDGARLVLDDHDHSFQSRKPYSLVRDPCELISLFETDPKFCTAIAHALDCSKLDAKFLTPWEDVPRPFLWSDLLV